MPATENLPIAEWASPARTRVLRALRASPDTGLHVRELARGAGLSLSSVQREIAQLDALGLLGRRASGNRVYVQLKHRDPLARLLLSADVAMALRGRRFVAMPSNRDDEQLLIELCAHMPPDASLWRAYGNEAFLAGIAVLLAGHAGFERDAYLVLADSLCKGAVEVAVQRAWLDKHRPQLARLFSMIDRERRTHARTVDQ